MSLVIALNKYFILIFIFQVAGQIQEENSFIQREKINSEHKKLEHLIERLIEEMQVNSRCMIFITDSYYENIIDINNIKALRNIPLFKLFVYDSETFSPPRSRVLALLNESQKSGCNSYIILMTNGMQVKSLLQYAESERLIDTRGYFLCMYDNRILRSEMSYLWNRILNVIFLRKYVVSRHKSGSLISREWFSLETIRFPVQAHEFVITQSIDIWNNDQFLYDGEHFLQKAFDLENKQIYIAVFEHFPAVINNAIDIYKSNKTTDKSKTLGVEFELILYIAKAMNFRPLFYKPTNIESEKWGVEKNGTYNGLLGEATEGKATFYLGEFHNTLKHHRLIDLSLAYNTECLTFLTPELLTDTSWKLLIIPFKLLTWITVIFTLIFGSAVVYFFSLFYMNYISYNKCIYLCIKHQVTRKEILNIIENNNGTIQKTLKIENMGLYLFTEAQNSALYIYSMLLQVSLPMLPRAWAIRVFIGCWWLYSILITVAYRASMTASLANPIEKKTIDTVKELAKSGIKIGGWIPETKEFFEMSDDPNVQLIAESFDIINNETEAINLVANGNVAYYENVYLLQQARVSRQLFEEAEQNNATEKRNFVVDRNLHVMEHCLIYMPVSLGMDKNSALKPRVDHLIRNAVEVGLVQKWLNDVMEWSKIAEKKQENEPAKATVNFQKLQGALVALGIGYFLGLLALIGEIIHYKYVILKNPAYDKYNLQEFYQKNAKTKTFCFKKVKDHL